MVRFETLFLKVNKYLKTNLPIREFMFVGL
jgi:hypothetical protein